MTFTYGDVDGSRDPGEAVVWQERVNARPDIRAYKEYSYALVAPADLVLDVGCGPGTDAAEIGAQRVVGVDPSHVMCRRAAERGITVCRGDAHRLPFADREFDAARADRVLQHLEDPCTALDELIRVTRPGGRIVVADPDQESLTLHVPGAPPDMVDQVKRLRRDVGYRNGRLASQLPARFAAAGLIDVEVRAFPLTITDPTDAFGLPTWPRWWHDHGIGEWTAADLDRWDQAIAALSPSSSSSPSPSKAPSPSSSSPVGFVFALLYFVVVGVRP